MRILYVTARYLPFVGGTESHTYEVARRLATKGNDITVLTTDPAGKWKPFECSEDIKIIRVPAWPKEKDYYFSPGIYKTISNGSWDLVHCQGYHTLVAPIAMVAARRKGLPYVLSFHSGGNSSKFRNSFRKFQRRMLRPLLKDANRLVAVSKFEEEFFSSELRLPIELFTVIPNGAYLPKPKMIQAAEVKGTQIVSVGRLERYKGHHRVLEALPKVLEHFPDVRLNIVGEGPYKDALQRMANKLGVAERVKIGGLDLNAREEMASLLMSANLVTLMSEYEAFPISVLEAIFLGCSVLVMDTSGLHELVEQNLVKAIPFESTNDEIVEAILNQLKEPHEPSMVKPASWDACATELHSMYRKILHSD